MVSGQRRNKSAAAVRSVLQLDIMLYLLIRRLCRRLHGLHNPTVQRKSEWCVLCRGEKSNRREYAGHRSKTKCLSCDVHLCLDVHSPARKSCWTVFHETKQLVRRVLPSSTPPTPSSTPRTPSSSSPVQVLPQRRGRSTSQEQNATRRLRSRPG